MSNDELHGILYVSSATRQMSEQELSSLYSTACKKNQAHDVTGVLLHSNGNFIQYLEGGREALQQIYHQIKQDRRHTGLIEIMNEAIEAREFPQWSLASKNEFFQTFSNPEQYASLLQPSLEHGTGQHSLDKELLHAFWNQNGRLRPRID